MSNSDNLKFPNGRSIEQIRKDAKRLKKQTSLTMTQALNQCAVENGLNLTWDKAIEKLKQTIKTTHVAITLKLDNPIPDKLKATWGILSSPTLELSVERNVGVIIGSAGSGKSMLTNKFMETSIKCGFTVFYRDLFNAKGFINSDRVHPNDIALNELSKLTRKHQEKFQFLTAEDPLPEANDKTLLVIDELHYLPTNIGVQDELLNYINNGGFVLISDQSAERIDSIISFTQLIGFTAISCQYPSHRLFNLNHSEFIQMQKTIAKHSKYAWFCTNEDELTVGAIQHKFESPEISRNDNGDGSYTEITDFGLIR